MTVAEFMQHRTLFRDKYRYVLGPSVAIMPDGSWIVAFNLGVMREVGPNSPRPWLHPPSDPEYRNVIIRSTDRGEIWDAPRVFPGYEWFGVENPGLCVLRNGDILASVYRRRFVPIETAQQRTDLLGAVDRAPYPWIVAHDGTYVHRSKDGGRTWLETVEVSTEPYISGYTPRGPVELDDGVLFLPLAAADPFYDIYFSERGIAQEPSGNERNADGSIRISKSAAFIAISRDGGNNWQETREIARDPGVNFYEPALAYLTSGRLLCHLRASSEGEGYLYQVISDDGGITWTPPARIPMWGFPADIVQLGDGRVLSVYGHRRPPFGIRACISDDDGSTWNMENEIILRDDLPSGNLGYPTSIVLEDDTVFTVYWGEEPDGVTTIQGTYYHP